MKLRDSRHRHLTKTPPPPTNSLTILMRVLLTKTLYKLTSVLYATTKQQTIIFFKILTVCLVFIQI